MAFVECEDRSLVNMDTVVTARVVDAPPDPTKMSVVGNGHGDAIIQAFTVNPGVVWSLASGPRSRLEAAFERLVQRIGHVGLLRRSEWLDGEGLSALEPPAGEPDEGRRAD